MNTGATMRGRGVRGTAGPHGIVDEVAGKGAELAIKGPKAVETSRTDDVRKWRIQTARGAKLLECKGRRKPWTIPLSIRNVVIALCAFVMRASMAVSLRASRRPEYSVDPFAPHPCPSK